MKKNKQEFEKQFEQDLSEYYNNIEVPEINVEKQEELRKLVKHNKPERKKITIWKRITAAASSVCLIALIIVPIIFLINKSDHTTNPETPPPAPIYYGKAEATKIQHTLEETQEIINSQFPKYNFMFTDLTYISSMGFYNPENNSLLSLKIYFNDTLFPYTSVEINIVSSEQFIFDEQKNYIAQADYIKNEIYEMYKTLYFDPFAEYELGYIVFEDHEIYINLASINEELFNKFI